MNRSVQVGWPETACEGKMKYLVEQYAEKAARSMKRTFKIKFTWYYCRYCAHWHVAREKKHV